MASASRRKDSAEAPVTSRATGTFDVKISPQPADAYADGVGVARMTIDKTFAGQLEGASKGQMLSAMGAVKGSAGYVAIERVSGTLAGRRGTFVFQHNASMDRVAEPDDRSGSRFGIRRADRTCRDHADQDRRWPALLRVHLHAVALTVTHGRDGVVAPLKSDCITILSNELLGDRLV